MKREHTCCFTGHRQIALREKPELRAVLRQRILGLYEQFGITNFLCGGAAGFDLLAGFMVLEQREIIPAFSLHLFLPCKNQAENWKLNEQTHYEVLLKRADSVRYFSERYTPGCMTQRNHAMVDHSSRCLAFLRQARGGTLQTVRYAEKSGVPVINLQEELSSPLYRLYEPIF